MKRLFLVLMLSMLVTAVASAEQPYLVYSHCMSIETFQGKEWTTPQTIDVLQQEYARVMAIALSMPMEKQSGSIIWQDLSFVIDIIASNQEYLLESIIDKSSKTVLATLLKSTKKMAATLKKAKGAKFVEARNNFLIQATATISGYDEAAFLLGIEIPKGTPYVVPSWKWD